MPRKVLIAGGTGLIGSHVVKYCQNENIPFLATYYSQQPSFSISNYRRYNFEQFEDCLKATANIDTVVFCAAKSVGVKAMNDSPTGTILPNLKIFTGLLEACRLNHVRKIILISSSTVYQESHKPLREDELDMNAPPYGLHRAIGWLYRYVEQLAVTYAERYGLYVNILRPTSVYGPFDKFDEERSNVIPALIRKAVAKLDPFQVWGSGKVVRDFIFVEDLASIIMQLLKEDIPLTPIGVGSGHPTSIETLAKTILKICNHPVPIQFDAKMPSSNSCRLLNLDRLQSIFQRRERTPLKEGLKKTIQWYRNQC